MALHITQGSSDDVDLLEPLWLGMLAEHREVIGPWERQLVAPLALSTLTDTDPGADGGAGPVRND